MNVGDTAQRTRTVTARDIELFTEITGDRNPLHYDEDLATRSRFGGIIVQGGVTSGLLNALVAEDLPGPGSVFLQVAWNFRAPVRPGDEITAEAEVIEMRVTVLDGTALVSGAHYCLGAALTRTEAQVALAALVALPDLELAIAEPVWRPVVPLHALESLPVTC